MKKVIASPNAPKAVGPYSQAILAGNTIIVKPPHQNPLTLIKLVALMHEAGVPNGVVQVITGEGKKTGEALASHPDVHGITFTGSTRAGVAVYEQGARHLAHVALELGGNDAFIVLKDAVKDGATFTGWYLDEKLTEKVTEIKEGSCGELKLYAGFKGDGKEAFQWMDAVNGIGFSIILILLACATLVLVFFNVKKEEK